MALVTFENPVYLWYLASIPLLIASHFYFLRYSKHKGLKFANFEALKRVSGEKLLTKNYALLLIRVIILLCLILAAAGTTIWYPGESNLNDFVLAIDVSASMTSQDVKPTRIDAAKEAANVFLNTINEQGIRTRVGLLTFSGATYIEELVTEDVKKVRDALMEIDVRREGGTDMVGAVVTGANMLLGSKKGKTIILISDGSQTISTDQDDSLRNALSYARNEHIVLHTIAIGGDSGPLGYLPEYYNISSVSSEETLIKLSNETGGISTHADSLEEISDAYKQVALNSNTAQLDIDLSYGLMLIALFLIFLEWGLISTKFKRLP